MNRGNRTESLSKANLPLRGSLRGSLRGRVFRVFSEVFRGVFQRFSEVLEVSRGFQSFLRGFQSF